ncbi:MAG: SlyX family protein [Candidatus Delongbacteria bacterium]
MEQRLRRVEEKLAHLERLTEQLNQVLREQDRRLEQLARALEARGEFPRTAAAGGGDGPA